MQFVKKPDEAVYSAEQYTERNQCPTGICGDADCEIMTADHVHTAHDNQAVALEYGDWVMPEPDGRGFYPIKNDIFVARYEPYGEPDTEQYEKTLHNSDISGARKNVPDIKVVGNGDAFQLLCKASSEREGWMKSTKALQIPNVGCVVQVTTQQKQGNGPNYAIAEAICFVPGARIVDDESGGRKLVHLDDEAK